MIALLTLWNADLHWRNAIGIGLAAVAGSTAGIGFHGRRHAPVRPGTSPE
jgi:hypothetical protein